MFQCVRFVLVFIICLLPASCHLFLRYVKSSSVFFFGSYRIKQNEASCFIGVCRCWSKQREQCPAGWCYAGGVSTVLCLVCVQIGVLCGQLCIAVGLCMSSSTLVCGSAHVSCPYVQQLPVKGSSISILTVLSIFVTLRIFMHLLKGMSNHGVY